MRFLPATLIALAASAASADGIRTALPQECRPHIKGLVPEHLVDCPPRKYSTPRISLSSYNFTAITPQAEPEDYARQYPYIATLPGLLIDKTLRDKCGKGQVVPAFQTKEAGVGAWWVWLRTRANRRQEPWGYAADASVSLAMLAEDICGCRIGADGNIPASLNYYRSGYASWGSYYFDREVGLDERFSLTDRQALWNLARTMFSHEAGRDILNLHLTEAQFLLGVKLGEAHVAGQRVNIADFIAR